MALLRGHQMKGEIKALRASRIFYAEIITKKLDPLKFAPPKDGCRIFLIRHAETEWNAEGKSQGWNDIPLNEEGKRQAALLGECFSNLSIEQIYASALSRAVETSQAIGKHHPDAAIVYDKALRFYDPDLKIPQQNETIEQMEARITQEIIDGATAYIKDICAKSQGQNIVFITHGKVIRSLLYALTGGILDPNKFKVGNTSMVRLFCDGDQLALENRLTNR
jgi:broad specificity phosphatase PhoE